MARTSSNLVRNLAGATALALVFNAVNANAAGLIDDDAAVNRYTPALIEAIKAAAPNDTGAGFGAGGFIVNLEAALSAREARPKVVDFPPRANAEFLRIIGVTPPQGLEHLPIPVCAEKNNQVLGVWNITPAGKVVKTTWNGATVSATPTSSACKDFIIAARNGFAEKLAAQPAAPAPKTSASIAIASPRT